MKLILGKNSTSITTTVFIQDSAAINGAGKTGLTKDNINAYYYKNGSNTYKTITLTSMTAGNWISGGFTEISSTYMPGVYSIGIPNEVLQDDSGNNQDNSVIIMITDAGINNVVPCLLEIQLTDTSLDDFATIYDIIESDVVKWDGANVLTPSISGVPEVDIKYVDGAPTAAISEVNANVIKINSDAQSAIDLKDLVDTGYNPVDHKIQGVVLTDATTDVSNSVNISSIEAAALLTVADAVLNRKFDEVAGEVAGARSALNSLRKLMNKVALSGGVLTIYKEDDLTSAFTQTVATDSSAQPVVSVDTV